ncbi:MAG TPA: hypothetical protein PKZ84_16715 [Anaerolineae bacterium]|nr:hypothetical protein [Anaerolineae bacterium]HQI85244.1 hypothetical protein [Anaerolineae bacterium]
MKDEMDATIAQIREVRHRISESLNHDPYQVVMYYMELQRQYAERMLVTEMESLPEEAFSQMINQPVLV